MSKAPLMDELYRVASALAEIALESTAPAARTIFPNESAAKDHVATLRETSNTVFLVRRSGDGTCSVQKFRLVRTL
jgi:hypothetical protein